MCINLSVFCQSELFGCNPRGFLLPQVCGLCNGCPTCSLIASVSLSTKGKLNDAINDADVVYVDLLQCRGSLSLTLFFSISLVLTKRAVSSITCPVVGFRLGIPLLGVIKTLRHISVGAHALILTPSFLACKWLTSS